MLNPSSRLLSLLLFLVFVVADAGALSAQSVSVTVTGKEAWQDTGINVSVGDTVTIVASGTIAYNTAGTKASPDGPEGTGGRPPALVDQEGHCTRLLCGQAMTGQALIGRIGSPDLKDFTTGFVVGARHSQVVTQSGHLLLGFNDGIVTPARDGLASGGIANNHGSFNVEITVKPRQAR